MRSRVSWLLLLVLLAGGVPAVAQDNAEPLPEEYTEEEFSKGARDLRRAEIILFGSFPLTLFLSLEAYDIWRFGYYGKWTDLAYAPWPLRPPAAAGYEDKESAGVLAAAITLSAALAIADYAIGKIRERRAENADRSRR